ncbi:GSCFA domain-containing protein [Patiriisocius sp. Uisw_047]|jgi:hypothetical protein|uniref:GSCFA domain-containing protein n=1 Tax=Patiriisocius sp. Uisw_047 TaxID=3230969 RepID=UPI0039E7B27E
MKLQTTLNIPAQNPKIDYASNVLLLGSCFSQNIAEKLAYFQFQSLSNPFGIVFNPVSIVLLMERALKNETFTEKDIFYHNERWQCYEVHSELSQLDAVAYVALLNEQLLLLKDSLLSASHVIITLGTAWVYELKETKSVVANCHKVPQIVFEKRLLSVSEIEASLQKLQSLLTEHRESATLIYTVSPVRHIKDGVVENSRSKAHVLTAVHNLKSHYFPSFEIMMDELRDYRFYAPDMLHPNQVAIDYIWERFNDIWIASETRPLQKKIAAIRQGLAHRPFNEDGDGHQKFLKNLQQKISEVKKELPWAFIE